MSPSKWSYIQYVTLKLILHYATIKLILHYVTIKFILHNATIKVPAYIRSQYINHVTIKVTLPTICHHRNDQVSVQLLQKANLWVQKRRNENVISKSVTLNNRAYLGR